MDWNMILFVIKWASIGLFYAILLLLLFGVYREMAQGARKEQPAKPIQYGRLRVIAVGSDSRFQVGSILDLQPETRLGADKDNDILLRDSYVSRHHAWLRWDGQAWWVEDLNSTNGTMVDRQRLAPGSPYLLSSGSVLSIGDMSFEIIDQDAG
jgi:pSer/pThr/pTyr-binding forkhead associated (FHA) protein